ncbi:MAG TPA: FecR domain-containing protein [Puia sp.]|nr:FecR domain-containing protein [Puia sp.]
MSSENSSERYQELAEKWLNGSISAEEAREYATWYNAGQDKEVEIPEGFAAGDQELRDRILSRIIGLPKRRGVLTLFRRRVLRVAAAAVVFLLMAGGTVYFLAHRTTDKITIATDPYKEDVLPGHNGAVLHLSNGQTIMLDSAQDGTVARQGTISVIKENGELKYVGKADEEIYNDITTARGRQWQLTLPDGTKVRLNAASSIHYPLAFTGPAREVTITGEVYFEVAHNSRQPFRVKVGDQVIEDMGTTFNVNAYADEPATKTTLVQGLVRVTRGSASLMILPGQEVRAGETSGLVLEKHANVEQALAWKNGNFNFDGLDTRAIMRQIARWYGIEVRYDGQPSSALFEGKMQRNLRLSQVLKGLDKCGVHGRLEGNTLIVLP